MKKQIGIIVSSLLLIGSILTSTLSVKAAQISSEDSAVVSVEAYEIKEGELTPGEQVTLELKLINNSVVTDATNVVLTFESSNYSLVPVYGEGNQVYIGTIAAGESKEITCKMAVSKDYQADNTMLKCNLSYASGSIGLGNSTVLVIPTSILGNLISESAVISGNAVTGIKTLVSVRYKNTGATSISGAKLIIEGNIEDQNKTIELPDIAAGKTNLDDYYVVFTQTGVQTLKLHYEYVDTKGTTYSIDAGEYVVNVSDSTEMNNSSSVIEETSSDNNALSILAFGVIVIIVLAMGIVYIKKRNSSI